MKPAYTLSDLICRELSDRGATKGKTALRMVATGLLGGIMSPVTAVGMLRSSVSSTEMGKLLAVGNVMNRMAKQKIKTNWEN